jgi:ankyrin repeat protein
MEQSGGFSGDVELTKRQQEIMMAVEYGDKEDFIRYGGSTGEDINFEVTRDGAFPLLIACAKGNMEFINLMLINPKLEVNK